MKYNLIIPILLISIFAISCFKEKESDLINLDNTGPINQADPNNNEVRNLSSEEQNIALINSNQVRMREIPSLNSKILDHFNENEKVIILYRSINTQEINGMNSKWYKVESEGKIEGWIYGAFLDLHFDENTVPEIKILENQYVKIESKNQLIGVWQPDMHFNPNQLILNQDNTFIIRMNYCQGITPMEGYFEINDGILNLYRTKCETCSDKFTFEWPVIEIALNDKGNLVYINEISTIMNGESVGYCSPHKDVILQNRSQMLSETFIYFQDPLSLGKEKKYNSESLIEEYGTPDEILKNNDGDEIIYSDSLKIQVTNDQINEITITNSKYAINNITIGTNVMDLFDIFGTENMEHNQEQEFFAFSYENYTLFFYYEGAEVVKIVWSIE